VSFPGRFVETSAGRVFVHRTGRGAPLVLVHGFMASHYIFRSVLQELAGEHDVIALDLPGFGESDRPAPDRYAYDAPAFARTIVEVLDRVGVERASLLGHSMGGGAVLAVAARTPERVERLVAVCPTVYPLPPQPNQALLMSRIGPFLWKRVMSRGQMARQWRARHVRHPESVSDELVDHVWTRLNRAGGREASYAAAQALTKLSNGAADPGRVRAPTLLVWPEEDRVVPLSHGKRLVRAVPGARLAVIPAAGHDVILDRPDEFLRQVQPFLAERSSELASVRSAQ
jgi:pimeloyl-ACP methyl ester carboxylesterase